MRDMQRGHELLEGALPWCLRVRTLPCIYLRDPPPFICVLKERTARFVMYARALVRVECMRPRVGHALHLLTPLTFDTRYYLTLRYYVGTGRESGALVYLIRFDRPVFRTGPPDQ